MVVMFPICLVFASILVSIVFTSTGDSDRPVMLPEQSRQTVSTGNSSRSIILGELQSVVDQRFASVELGDRVSRDVSKVIGCGTYGNVYEGTLQPEQTKVAVKVVRYGDHKSALPVLQEVLREIYVWSKLKHENVIELLGMTAIFDQTISMVSPLMSRGNAIDYVQNPDVDPRPLILGIANGLHYLHTYEQGPVIHGDIKGTNMLVSNDGHALLTDFGFSHLAEASFSLAVEQRPGGTLNWMAPEYLEGDEFTMTTAGDVWAFGMIALELFTRKRPFDNLKNKAAVMYQIVLKEWERPSSDTSCSRLTDKWWNICLSCWNRNPSWRPSMSNIVENIRILQTFSKVDTGSLLRRPYTRRTSLSDPTALGAFARRALRYSTILDGWLVRDERIFLGGFSEVRSGNLSPGGKGMKVATVEGGSQNEGKNMKVAIKTSRNAPPGDINTIKCVLKEVHIWSKLRHDHTVPLLGITTDFNMTLSIVTPWMERGSAHDHVQDCVIDPRPLIWGIAQGLHYLHNHPSGPIIHGGINGHNVLISDDGRALIYDFDFSLLRNSSFSMSVSNRKGDLVNWTAPEMLDNFDASTEADVWALGMTTLELFTRKIPFHECRGPSNIITSILKGQPRRPSDKETCYRMTPQWWDMCLSCWNRKELRPSTLDIIGTISKMMGSILTRHDETTMDATRALEEISKLASSYGFDVSEQIELDRAALCRDHTDVAFRGKLRRNKERIMAHTSPLYRPEEIMVAVKANFGGLPLNVEVFKHMVEGIHALTKLRHENILPLFGISTKFHGKISLVSEWMEKGSAREFVQSGDIDPRPLLLGVANGLQYLHSHTPQPIFHGALKGSNVLISSNDRALLTGFGLFDLVDSSTLVNRVGTINWMAPETLDGPTGSAAGDVWALGMTALELFTRKLPFHSINSSEELQRRIHNGPPDRPNDEATQQRLTDWWWHLCLSCWSHDPSHRPSIDKVLEMIEYERMEDLRCCNRNKRLRILMQSTS